MALDLTPAEIAIADYPIAQTPVLGGENEVYLTAKAARLIGVLHMIDDTPANAEWDGVNIPSAVPGPLIALVQNELTADAAAVITYAGISGTFQAAEWAKNQGFDFAVGKAVELDGTYSAPADINVKPTITNAKRGTKIAIIEMPALADFKKVGATTTSKIKMPANTSKAIARNLNSAYWTTQGRTEIGTLDITGLDHGPEDGLGRFAGMKTVAMVRVMREEKVLIRREFYIDYTPNLDRDNPESDGESTVSVTGMFSRAAIIVAPGTPAA